MARKPKDKKEPASKAPAAEAKADAKPEAAEAPRFPLFYKAPRPVEATRHAKSGLIENMDVGFAADANAIPVNIVEFAVAARHYPIVFSTAEPSLPVVVSGLRTGTNAFIGADNTWARGFYIPAYVRRYPFILMENAEKEQFILCVDEESGAMTDGGERQLFNDDGKPSELTDRALEFCRAYHGQYEATRQFVAALNEHDLLTENSTEIRLTDDRKIQMQGYKVIDREKFDKLPDDVFLDWRKKNWLPVVYSHLLSLSNWPSVLQRAADRAMED
jgi:hypothetical protein